MEPAEALCDNNSLVLNTSNVKSKLNKKHNFLAFHAIRWALAADLLRVTWIDGSENLADALTKNLSREVKKYLWQLDILT